MNPYKKGVKYSTSKVTTFRSSVKIWELFQQKILKDKQAIRKFLKRKIRLNQTTVLNCFMWLLLNKKFTVNLTADIISTTDCVQGIIIDRDLYIDIRKFIIDFESQNKVPTPAGLGGILNRLIYTYLHMDFREVASKMEDFTKVRK